MRWESLLLGTVVVEVKQRLAVFLIQEADAFMCLIL